MRTVQSIRRGVALTTALSLLAQVFIPAGEALALTGGPKQPDFSSFEPVSTTNMVDPLSGQFTYNLPVVNIPGPNGAGYALSLSYHSGLSPEQEASWVGYGWTLNAGSITRVKRGLPDDYDGDVVRVWNRSEPNWTVSVGVLATPEFFGQQPFGTLGASAALRYNNYKGFGYTAGITADVKGIASLSASIDDGDLAFTPKINPGYLLNKVNQAFEPHTTALSSSYLGEVWLSAFRSAQSSIEGFASYSTSNIERPTAVTGYDGTSINVKLDLAGEPAVVPVAPDFGVTGSYTRQSPKGVGTTTYGLTKLAGYGYMYSGNATSGESMMQRRISRPGVEGLPLRARRRSDVRKPARVPVEWNAEMG